MTHIYAGAETSGLYRLSPGSEHWEELTAGLPESPSVCGIAIHPESPEIVFAGTQDGPYRSLNSGRYVGKDGLPQGGAAGLEFHVPPR